MFTKTLQQKCNFVDGKRTSHLSCLNTTTNVTVHPKERGNPISYLHWKDFFTPSKLSIVENHLNNGALVIHLWNTMRKRARGDIKVSTKMPLYKIVERQCPVTEANIFRKKMGLSRKRN